MIVQSHKVAFLEDSILASGLPRSTESQVPTRSPTEHDWMRAAKLGSVRQGAGDDNYLKGIKVMFWLYHSEVPAAHLLRYNFLEVVSSESKQHCALSFDLTSPNRWDKEVTQAAVDHAIVLQRQALALIEQKAPKEQIAAAKDTLIANLPPGFRMLRCYVASYLQLKTIWNQRHNHRWYGWRDFCNWMVRDLPNFAELTQCSIKSTKGV
jgi:hypothetical protein